MCQRIYAGVIRVYYKKEVGIIIFKKNEGVLIYRGTTILIGGVG